MKVQADTIEQLFTASGPLENDLREIDRIIFKRLSDITIPELQNAIGDAYEWSQVMETIYGRNCPQPVNE